MKITHPTLATVRGIPATICSHKVPSYDEARMNEICQPLLDRGFEFRTHNEAMERGTVTCHERLSGAMVATWWPHGEFSAHQ